jgi:hypothetical protein
MVTSTSFVSNIPVGCFFFCQLRPFLSIVSFPGQERSRHPTGGLAQALTAPHGFAPCFLLLSLALAGGLKPSQSCLK